MKIIKKFWKEHPLNDFKLGKTDVYATHIEKQNESANNFAITLSFSGKILFNELEKLENFKEMLKSYFIKEIEEKSQEYDRQYKEKTGEDNTPKNIRIYNRTYGDH